MQPKNSQDNINVYYWDNWKEKIFSKTYCNKEVISQNIPWFL